VEKGESDGEMRRVPTPHHTAAQGHYPIELIRWLQLTEVGLYLMYPRSYEYTHSRIQIQFSPCHKGLDFEEQKILSRRYLCKMILTKQRYHIHSEATEAEGGNSD